ETVGEIHAPDLEAAREQLRIRGLLAHSLRELPASGEDNLRTAFKKIKPRSMQVFSRQFATMIEAGLNIVAALVILEQQTDDAYLAVVIAELRADVEGGLLLSQAMARHPKVFDELYVSMVQAGEASGLLDNVLDRVADQIEKSTKLKRRVKGAMVYPTVVFTFATLVLIAMLMFIVPIFARIFTSLGGQLPFLTRIVVHASNLLRHQWYIIFQLVGFMIWGALRYKKTESGRQMWDRFKLRIPLRIGEDALKVSQKVKTREETRELEQMLSKSADFYEEEVDAASQTLTSIIEPLLMIAVGFMVGIIGIAMYLPMFKMMQLIGNQ